jgi:hypothetical protein
LKKPGIKNNGIFMKRPTMMNIFIKKSYDLSP